MKKIVLTGGGTLGHVTPHLALIPRLQEAGYEIHYIGTENGMEAPKMRAVEGVTYHAVKSGKLRRYHDWKNFTDPFRVIAGAFQSARLMGKIKPDVVFSKGGFVAVPVVFGAWLHRIPVLCHESDLTPGLANKLCKPFASRFATTFPECAEALGSKAEMTGTPLRPELFTGSREKGLSLLGFDGQKPVLLMMGGSSGAQSVNACPTLISPISAARATWMRSWKARPDINRLNSWTRTCRTYWPARIWCSAAPAPTPCVNSRPWAGRCC